jgi:urease accessory protein
MLLLADGRFPSGGHAHSNGFEAADRIVGLGPTQGSTATQAVTDYVVNRLATSGAADAALVAAVVHRQRDRTITWSTFDDEAEARLPGPAQRDRSRALGRQWLRAGRRLWPGLVVDAVAARNPDGPHELPAFAAVAFAAGLDPLRAAMVHLHHLVAGITTAAIRLRGLDPYDLQAVQIEVVPLIEELAVRAEAGAGRAPADLPAPAGPLFEVLAQAHAGWDDRLFQS